MKKFAAVTFAGLVCILIDCGMTQVVRAAVATQDPLSLPLVQANNFSLTFLGSFKVPQGTGDGQFAYGGGGMSVNGSDMYLTGTYYYNSGNNHVPGMGEVLIPALTGSPAYNGANGTATVVENPMSPGAGGGPPSLNCGQSPSNTYCVYLGSLVYENKLYVSIAPFFDTENGANGFLIGANVDLSNWGSVNSASAHCLSGVPERCTQRYFAGALGLVPAIWRPYLGGPCYEANGPYLPIESNSVNGFGFATFDCAAYSSAGGAIPVSESLDYYYGGVTPREPSPYMLQYRSFSGPFPLAGGGGCIATLASVPVNGDTRVVLSAGFSGCDTASVDGPYDVTFSDGETRLVHLTNGNSNIPDNLYTCNYGVTGCSSFPALTGCPASGCALSITVNPVGDNYFSEYDGPTGYGFIVPGSRTLLFISVHEYGPSADRGTGCYPNASGGNDTAVPGDTANYVRVQLTAYDLSELYEARQGKIPVYSISPYAFWSFPGWRAASNAVSNCVGLPGTGSFFFDPTTSTLYGTFSSNGYGYGNMIVEEWRVNPLTVEPDAPSNIQVNY